MDKKKYRIGGLLTGLTLTIADGLLKFQSAYGKRFSVPLNQIDAVTVDNAKRFGYAKLKVIGHGTDLGTAEMPSILASKAQAWLMENLEFTDKESKGSLNDLEKLAELKEKGVLTEEEFSQKKRQLLGL